eukprot:TRINITY_DN3377_c0_g2_i1.p1 TRINITY_DN3377_c0_g2~~TRINITY_DN3377_c0_g2_i1.p1  ORF type:complete len:1302 (+),score=140.62 TRINITY_DN3377_c0_g2_i1:67-3972(+)
MDDMDVTGVEVAHPGNAFLSDAVSGVHSSGTMSPISDGSVSYNYPGSPNTISYEAVAYQTMALLEVDSVPDSSFQAEYLEFLLPFRQDEDRLRIQREEQQKRSRAPIAQNQLQAIIYPPNLPPTHEFSVFQMHPFKLIAHGLDWQDQYDTFVLLPEQGCSCHHDRNRPHLRIASQLLYLNARNMRENVFMDDKGVYSFGNIPDGRTGQVCTFLCSQPGVEVEILDLTPHETAPSSTRQRVACVRQDSFLSVVPSEAQFFQFISKAAIPWTLSVRAGGHDFSFTLQVRKPPTAGAPKNPRPKKTSAPSSVSNDSSDESSTQSESSGSGFESIDQTATIVVTSSSTAVPTHPQPRSLRLVELYPSFPRDVPQNLRYVLIGNGPTRAWVDLHVPSSQEHLRALVDTPFPQYYAAEVFDSTGAPKGDWDQDQGDSDWIRSREGRPSTSLLKLELPPAQTLRYSLLWGVPESCITYEQYRVGTLQVLLEPQQRARLLLSRVPFVLTESGHINSYPQQMAAPTSSGPFGGAGEGSGGQYDSGASGSNGSTQAPNSGFDAGQSSSVFMRNLCAALARTIKAGTALHAFSMTNHKHVVEGLLALFSTEKQLNNGATPLHLAAYSAPSDVVELIAASPGADKAIRTVDCQGSTPIEVALAAGRENIANLLRRRFPPLPSLPEDVLFHIGENCNFETLTRLLLATRAGLRGLLQPRGVGAPLSFARPACVHFQIVHADSARDIFDTTAELLLARHVVFLDVLIDDSRFCDPILKEFVRKIPPQYLRNLKVRSLIGFTPMSLEECLFDIRGATRVSISVRLWLTSSSMLKRINLGITHVEMLNIDQSAEETGEISLFLTELKAAFPALQGLKVAGFVTIRLFYSILDVFERLEELQVISTQEWTEPVVRTPPPQPLRLRSLTIDGYRIRHALPPLVGELRSLTSLCLRESETTLRLPAAYFGLTSLRNLEMGRSFHINADDFRNWIGRLPHLQSLRVRVTDLRPVPEDVFVVVEPLHLRKISIAVGRSISIAPHALAEARLQEALFAAWFSSLTALEELELDLASLTDTQIESIAGTICSMKNLKRLRTFIVQPSSWSNPGGTSTNPSKTLWSCLSQAQFPQLRILECGDVRDAYCPELRMLIDKSASLRQIDCDTHSLSRNEFLLFLTSTRSAIRNLEAGLSQVSAASAAAPQSLRAVQKLEMKAQPEDEVDFVASLSPLENICSLTLSSAAELFQKDAKVYILPSSFGTSLPRLWLLDSLTLNSVKFADSSAEISFAAALATLPRLRQLRFGYSPLSSAIEHISLALQGS